MASLLPAMRGKFGSTEFYIITMRAKELTEKLTIPKEMENDGWENLSIEEKYQREINYTRVKKHIAPYLVEDEDRFFGAFIVDVMNGDDMQFEPITDIAKKLPSLYEKTANSIGTLTLQGNEILIPLDGQHRVAALKFAISGKDEKQKDISGLTPNPDIANDVCTVILVKHDDKKARKIFNKVNRYAKSTSKSDNLITADDDIIAVVSREQVAKKVINDRLVNYQSNTLTPKMHYFTTLGIIYDATKLILEDELSKRIDITKLPHDAEITICKTTTLKFWQEFIKIQIFSDAVDDTTEEGDNKRKEIRKNYTLGKPIVQLALIDACIRLRQEDSDTGARVSWDKLRKRIDSVDWTVANPLWQGVLMNGPKIITGKTPAKFAARFISYYLGEKLEKIELETLSTQFKEQQGNEKKNLPSPKYPL